MDAIFFTHVMCFSAHKKCDYMRTKYGFDTAVHDDEREVLDDVRILTMFLRKI